MKPIREKIKGLRQRQRGDGSWRVWWEPSAAGRAAGLAPVDLDPERPTWSIGKARELGKDEAAALDAGTKRSTGPGGRTIDALINDYRRSRFFKERKPATRRDYDIKLNAIARKWGSYAVAQFTKPVMNQWYETILDTGKAHWAAGQLRMMSVLMSHAETIGWRPEGSNPCFRLKMKATPKRGRRATWNEFDALMAAADQLHQAGDAKMQRMATAIALSILCAQRREDILHARLSDFRDMQLRMENGAPVDIFGWELTRSKRGTYGIVPVHEEVAPRIRALQDQAAAGDEFLMAGPDGAPILPDTFWKLWKRIRAAAAKEEPTAATLQFRDLRRTFGKWSRAGGASKSDVADVLGNTADQDAGLSEVYMAPSLDTVLRAQAAVRRPGKGAA
ncbi:tyrosine-type recombinase/integrase [Roseovarius atlanticus]|uniref:tyrosine-type recombinase/integrase n=1 Tax=Roseovarius atlanticus TaxID=1641875 RepID=UPI001C94A484|nr:tyrosine-type recombinase/integrase [Roseovarius atlanticus]MBY5988183.1 site-specific integrase [Roseovarius atlanticus]MBY6123574.1 site-specific integrase [Roseovarius atlanticus]MBY6148069.1 site-specific integrase [Roseovarius atlanticus]